jgi:hypothetical protein
MSVNEVLEAVRALSPEERAKVHALLETLQRESKSPEERARQSLREAGLLTGSTPREANTGTRHSPVPIKGKSLSDTIIEERG